MSLQNNPILNGLPGSQSLGDSLMGLFDIHSQNSENMLPAKVISFDRAKNLATVQPMIMVVDTNNNSRNRHQLVETPVLSLGGGGYHISFPLKEGDLGWIIAADRDISQFMQTLDISRPNTYRKHKFSDSWFIPDVFRQYTINSEDSSAMVIQTLDGSTRISIDQGKVTITAPGSVKVDTPMATFTHDVTVQGNVIIDKNLTVTGLTAVNGGFVATGAGGNQACTLPASTTIGGIAVYGHGHIETNAAGGRTSGGMIQ